jgi:hypothetical protein
VIPKTARAIRSETAELLNPVASVAPLNNSKLPSTIAPDPKRSANRPPSGDASE